MAPQTYSTTTETNKELELDANGSYVVSLENLKSITLNVPNVTDKDCCFMLYIDKQDATTMEMSITNVNNLNTGNANDIRVGMNNFVVSNKDNSITLAITSTGHSGSIIIMPLRVTNMNSANDILGLSSSELNEVNTILAKYKTISAKWCYAIIFLPIYPNTRTNKIPTNEPQLSIITSRTEALRPFTKN